MDSTELFPTLSPESKPVPEILAHRNYGLCAGRRIRRTD